MNINVPEELQNDNNSQVLEYIKDLSAHDGVVDNLLASVKPLGDVEIFCPDSKYYRFYVVSTNNIIFGVALGQDVVAYRLNDEYKEKALLVGCKVYPELGSNWLWVNPNSGDWPEIDYQYWARASYVSIREA